MLKFENGKTIYLNKFIALWAAMWLGTAGILGILIYMPLIRMVYPFDWTVHTYTVTIILIASGFLSYSVASFSQDEFNRGK